MTQQFSGATEEVAVPKLDAGFWSEGRTIEGVVEAIRQTEFGNPPKKVFLYRLALSNSVEVEGDQCELVEVGNLSGFRMAMQAINEKHPGVLPLMKGDVLSITCSGIKRATPEQLKRDPDWSDRPNFRVSVTRPEKKGAAR